MKKSLIITAILTLNMCSPIFASYNDETNEHLNKTFSTNTDNKDHDKTHLTTAEQDLPKSPREHAEDRQDLIVIGAHPSLDSDALLFQEIESSLDLDLNTHEKEGQNIITADDQDRIDQLSETQDHMDLHLGIYLAGKKAINGILRSLEDEHENTCCNAKDCFSKQLQRCLGLTDKEKNQQMISTLYDLASDELNGKPNIVIDFFLNPEELTLGQKAAMCRKLAWVIDGTHQNPTENNSRVIATPTVRPFDMLPRDLLKMLLGYLPLKDMTSMLLVDRRFRFESVEFLDKGLKAVRTRILKDFHFTGNRPYITDRVLISERCFISHLQILIKDKEDKNQTIDGYMDDLPNVN